MRKLAVALALILGASLVPAATTAGDASQSLSRKDKTAWWGQFKTRVSPNPYVPDVVLSVNRRTKKWKLAAGIAVNCAEHSPPLETVAFVVPLEGKIRTNGVVHRISQSVGGTGTQPDGQAVTVSVNVFGGHLPGKTGEGPRARYAIQVGWEATCEGKLDSFFLEQTVDAFRK